MKNKKVLLINPSSVMSLYKKSAIKAAISEIPYLSSAVLAASLLKNDIETEILDLSVSSNPKKDLILKIRQYNPTHIGITFTTPLFFEAKRIAKIIKKINRNIILICGGVHSTALPYETLETSDFDILCYGEGDITIVEIIKTDNINALKKVKGIFYKDKNNKIHTTSPRDLIKDLDSLPLPAWHLYDLTKYKSSKLSAKYSPVGPIETSRGCVYKCAYCNKKIFGATFRFKSVKRVVKEFEYLKKCGFREIHVWDDMFTTHMPRAKEICDEITRRKIKISWALTCGIRVNNVDQEIFHKLKKAGCHAVYFGVESGDQEILNRINKGITLEQAKRAVYMAKKAGLETVTFFMLGLPGETKETIKKTINFATHIGSDYAKTTILTPYPGTKIFDEFDEKGVIITKDWAKYNFHSASKVYNHPTLSWKELEKYYTKFHRKFYFRTGYIFNRILKDIKTGFLFWDIYYTIKTFF